MNKHDTQKIIDFLRQTTNIIPRYCDACGNALSNDDIDVMGNRERVVSCRVHCSNCKTTHLLNVSLPASGMGVASRSPMNIDLESAAEFNKFAGKKAVTSQDAIHSYKSLEGMRTIEDFLEAFSD